MRVLVILPAVCVKELRVCGREETAPPRAARKPRPSSLTTLKTHCADPSTYDIIVSRGAIRAFGCRLTPSWTKWAGLRLCGP